MENTRNLSTSRESINALFATIVFLTQIRADLVWIAADFNGLEKSSALIRSESVKIVFDADSR
ncbi:MAG: hypothetical protein EAZ37_01925 [Burkholderiales bacterium]|nr:MAG: hypothetical protein EAZ43_13355 [Betaproteobacteria bacterium]TAG28295.1 MAG: hypothetical protein EAZ37_01925 [Burkholderiales bacterium]TAG73398.1 MAG: hypothetical protein EAZ24_11795 [Burkholderiales bacterium]